MDLNLAELEALIAVNKHGSFTAAARALGLNKSTLSVRITHLEERLGVQLFHRSTRQVRTTSAGAVLSERVSELLRELEDAQRAVQGHLSEPRGPLRISAPLSFGAKFLAPSLGRFAATYPDLQVDISLTDRKVNLIEEGYDVAIRIGTLPDSSLVARRLGTVRRYTVASVSWLEENGPIVTPDDLQAADALVYSHHDQPTRWRFESEGARVDVTLRERMRSNNGSVLLEAAAAGAGVGLVPDFFFDKPRPELRRVLPRWEPSFGIWAMFPHRRHLNPAVRALLDALSQPDAGCLHTTPTVAEPDCDASPPSTP